MTSNLRRTLQAALAVVAVGWSAAEARAQDLETPDAAPKGAAAAAPAAPPSAGPTGFGDSGQFLISVEDLFGYTYSHQSNQLTVNTFTIFGDGLGDQKSMYEWPRLAFDFMLINNISLGAAASVSRYTTSVPATIGRGASVLAYAISLRAGYATMIAPSVGIWPRLGVTYGYQTGNQQSALALTVDGLLVIVAAPHLAVTFGPVLDWGLSGKQNNANVTFLTIGAYFGLAIPF
jgi:hypothetical protein